MTLPELCTLSEFAAIARVKKGYVSQLRKAGRLVMSDDGKAVRVRDSLALIEATRSPAHVGVGDRHAAARGEQTGFSASAPVGGGDGAQAEADDDAVIAASPHSERRAKALADKAETDAKAAERDYRISMGDLLDADQVEQAVGGAVTTFRQAIEQLRDTLAPELATATDEARVRVLLGEALEHALEELARGFAAIGRREAA